MYINVIYYIVKSKNKNHLLDIENPFEKFKHASWLHILETLGIYRAYINMIKAIYEKPISNRMQAKKTEKYFF